jgi:hypothetical protein
MVYRLGGELPRRESYTIFMALRMGYINIGGWPVAFYLRHARSSDEDELEQNSRGMMISK